jgi:hypothetical protein
LLLLLLLTILLTSSMACPSAVAWKPEVIIAPMMASMSPPLLKSWPLMMGVSGTVSVGTSTAWIDSVQKGVQDSCQVRGNNPRLQYCCWCHLASALLEAGSGGTAMWGAAAYISCREVLDASAHAVCCLLAEWFRGVLLLLLLCCAAAAADAAGVGKGWLCVGMLYVVCVSAFQPFLFRDS